MTKSVTFSMLALASFALAGCVANTSKSESQGSHQSGTPTSAEQACLRDVTRTTNNPDVVLLGSKPAGAGTEVIVGVGAQRARWRCIGHSNGSTSGIMSLTNEGRL
jgi:hypothetical protein